MYGREISLPLGTSVEKQNVPGEKKYGHADSIQQRKFRTEIALRIEKLSCYRSCELQLQNRGSVLNALEHCIRMEQELLDGKELTEAMIEPVKTCSENTMRASGNLDILLSEVNKKEVMSTVYFTVLVFIIVILVLFFASCSQ